jgi:hypothetical protein
MALHTAAPLLAILACYGTCAHAVVAVGRGDALQEQQKSLRASASAPAADEGVVKAFKFDQKLLICNAYPSSSPMVAQMNGKDITDAGRPIGFRECRTLASGVQAGDRLDLSLRDVELQSTFEVNALPPSDAELLLVPYKKKNSPMIRFQSFAFPTRADGKDAQLALIDTFAGNSTMARVRMEDHIQEVAPKAGKDGHAPVTTPAPKRMEELNFDRVYSVEAGVYNTAVDEDQVDMSAGRKPQLVNLAKDQNYVFIRMGDGQNDFPESLVVFPETPLPPSPPSRSGARASAGPLGFLALAATALGAAFLL